MDAAERDMKTREYKRYMIVVGCDEAVQRHLAGSAAPSRVLSVRTSRLQLSEVHSQLSVISERVNSKLVLMVKFELSGLGLFLVWPGDFATFADELQVATRARRCLGFD